MTRLGIALAVTGSVLLAQNCPERTLGTALGAGDDVMFGIQPIGFAFPFGGTTYTDVHVCTNGFVNLSNAGAPAPGAADYTATAAELASGSPRIAPLWTDLLMPATGSCYVRSTPTQCTVTWDRATNYGSPAEFQIQLQLFPSGAIKIFYSAGAINASTFSTAAAQAIVGVSPGLGASLPAPSNLSTAGVTPDNTLFEAFTGGQFDMPATSLQLNSTVPGWTWSSSVWSLCASTSNYGGGCIQANDSFYQLMPASQFDMSNRTLTMLRQGNGYVVLDSIPGVFVPPSAAAVQVAPGDDSVQTVPIAGNMPVAGGVTSALTICSNAHIALSATGNGTSIGPTVPVFLGWTQTVVGCIHDYDQGGIAYVTWDNVITWNTTSADTMQFQFNEASGDITIVFGAFNPAGNNYLVGYSVGGVSPDPGTTDVSTAFAIPQLITDVPAGPGLALTGTGLPVLGQNFQFDIANAPNLVPIGILFFGLSAVPGIDLGFIGAPSCRAYCSADLISLNVPLALPAGTGSQGLAIPPSPTLAGFTLTSQAAAFTLANPLGLVTSNGTTFTVGY
jgi:hypothetical protein